MACFLGILLSLAAHAENKPAEPTPTKAAIVQAQPLKDTQSIKVKVSLQNGIVLIGTTPLHEVISWSKGKDISFTPEAGKPTTITGNSIASLQMLTKQAGESKSPKDTPQAEAQYRSPNGFPYINPAASRYLYAPSSIALEKGQGYVSQKLLFTSVAYGVNDNFTLLAGTFTLFPPALTVLGGKYSISLSDNISISTGAEAFIIGFDSTIPIGIGFGALTLGNTDRHLTIASGVLYDRDNGFVNSAIGIPLMIAGHRRFSTRGAFVTENWILFDPNQQTNAGIATVLNSVAFRLIGKRDKTKNKRALMLSKEGYPRTTWDFGFLLVHTNLTHSQFDSSQNKERTSDFTTIGSFGPLPWIDFAWHFGPASRRK